LPRTAVLLIHLAHVASDVRVSGRRPRDDWDYLHGGSGAHLRGEALLTEARRCPNYGDTAHLGQIAEDPSGLSPRAAMSMAMPDGRHFQKHKAEYDYRGYYSFVTCHSSSERCTLYV
jgi:hypothetical protein